MTRSLGSRARFRAACGEVAALALAALLALAAPSPAAASGAAARAASPAPRRSAAMHAAHPRPAAADSASARAAGRVGSLPRRLDDIHIEGEIPVPQVLFITAREQRRFMEFQHHRYQRTSLELGRATATPVQIVVTQPVPAEPKEEHR